VKGIGGLPSPGEDQKFVGTRIAYTWRHEDKEVNNITKRLRFMHVNLLDKRRLSLENAEVEIGDAVRRPGPKFNQHGSGRERSST
jgi:hypothetical protein